ncbi:DoxX family protein [Echinicola salinicaeni]|uniref:DoxX family protein n=1 Tax=Echinicola salinicaeni TaxID=2762757 RepID=UPI0016461647|nr:DoxX family protein [Echinicola salinicaeni]
MKKDNIIYWVTTAIVAVMMLFSAYNYFADPNMKAGFEAMGFPDFFRIELGTAKIIGALVLLIPGIPQLFKTSAYVGFVIVFVSAFITHLALGDAVSALVMPLVFLAILLVSFRFQQKRLVTAKS